MTKNPQQPESFDDELLSAYIDGELTGEQLVMVEKRLANNRQSQQLVDELNALSASLQAMPRLGVDNDLQAEMNFRAEVLQRAERAMLLGGDDQRATLPQGQLQDSASTRRWIWAAAAIAAALLLSVYMPNTQQEKDIRVASIKPVPKQQPSVNAPINENAETAMDESGTVGTPLGESNEARSRLDEFKSDSVEAEDMLSEPEIKPRLHLELAMQADEVNGGTKAVEGTKSFDAPLLAKERIAGIAGAPLADSLSSSSSPAPLANTDDAVSEPLAAKAGYACEVHITLNEGPDNFRKFDQTLFSNGIVLQESVEPLQDKDSGSKGRLGFGSGHGGGEPRGVATRSARRRGQNGQFKKGQSTVQEELLLIEVQVDQFENLLEDINADTESIASVRLVADPLVAEHLRDGKESEVLSLERWQRYDRSHEQPDLSKEKQGKNRYSHKKKRSLRDNRLQRGRAQRLNTDQYSYGANGKLNVDQRLINQYFQQEIKSAKIIASKAPTGLPSASAPIQVLIILQQQISGETAPADRELTPKSTPSPGR